MLLPICDIVVIMLDYEGVDMDSNLPFGGFGSIILSQPNLSGRVVITNKIGKGNIAMSFWMDDGI